MQKWILLTAIVVLTASCGQLKKDSAGSSENSLTATRTEKTGGAYYRGSQPVMNVVAGAGRIVHN